MTAHKIVLKRKGNNVVPDPDPATIRFNIGDTLEFTSETGRPRVTLEPGHGFSTGHFEAGDQPLKVTGHGKFVFHCNIVLDDGTVIGWRRKGLGLAAGGEGQT